VKDFYKTSFVAVKAVFLAAGALLSVWGAWLAIPRQSHTFEALQSSCPLASGAVVRLFLGNGGATTGYWFSVSIQTGGPWSEEYIFNAEPPPALKAIKCEGSVLQIVGSDQTWQLDEADVHTDLAATLRKQLRHGGSDKLPFVDHARMIFGAVVLATGLLIMILAKRTRLYAAQPGVAADGVAPRS
jgi:hypothetical protein